MNYKLLCLGLMLSVLVLACGKKKTYLPKPKCYNIIKLPVAAYQKTTFEKAPYQFEYSTHATLTEEKKYPFWYSLNYPSFNANINLTYFDLSKSYKGKPSTMYAVFEDHRKLIYAHTDKATGINEKAFRLPNGRGVYFELNGQIATPAQFFISDSLHHVVVGNMYFNTATKNDSLAPVISFIKKDLQHLYQSIQWKTK